MGEHIFIGQCGGDRFLGVHFRSGGLSFILFGGGSIGISQWVVKDFAS